MLPPYSCPLCKHPLYANQQGLSCVNGHQFDRARQGYFNLLPVQHKKSKQPGDNLEMVRARRDFLQSGHYQPLAKWLHQLSQQLQPQLALDIGCGEGYYSHHMQQGLQSGQLVGLDISKEMIRLASKQYPKQNWLVGSSKLLPFDDQQIDLLCCIFSFYQLDELLRVLKPGGQLIWVNADQRHLWQLRERLYPEVHTKECSLPAELIQHFHIQKQESLHWQIQLNKDQALALMKMTPHYWRAKKERREQASQGGFDKLEVAVKTWLMTKLA